eukprot:212263-Alexandrium_andersonii.AAC.1
MSTMRRCGFVRPQTSFLRVCDLQAVRAASAHMTVRWLTRGFLWQAGWSCGAAGASGPWMLIAASGGGRAQPV